MPEARVNVIVKPLGAGLWDVTAAFYFNQADEEHKIREGCWIELVEVPGWGAPNKIVVGSTDIPYAGSIKFTGLSGSDSDTPAYMKVYWLYVHYQKGHPGTAQGPEYRVIHDFWLGNTAWHDGVDTSTEVISSVAGYAFAAARPLTIAGPLRAAIPAAGPIVLGLGLLFLALRK